MFHYHVLLLTLLSVLLASCQTCNSKVIIPGYYDNARTLHTQDSNSLHIDPYALSQSESIDAFIEANVLTNENKDSIYCGKNVDGINTTADKTKRNIDKPTEDYTSEKLQSEHKCEHNMENELADIHRRDVADLEKWNRWKHRVLHAERDRERRTKEALQKKGKSGSKEWYVLTSDLLEPYKIAQRAVTRTQKLLLSDSLNVYEYLADLLQSARALRTECEKMFVESSFQKYTEKKFGLRDDSRAKVSGSTNIKVSSAAANATGNDSNTSSKDNTNNETNDESDSDIAAPYNNDVDVDDHGKLRFIGEVQEWYEHALINSSAKQYNTTRLQWKISSMLFIPSWIYKTLATYMYDATHVLPDSFVAYSTVLQAVKREGHLLNSSLQLIQHRLPELEAQREVRLKQERNERLLHEEENEDNTTIHKTNNDGKNSENDNNIGDKENKNEGEKGKQKSNINKVSSNQKREMNTEIVNTTPISDEGATRPIVKEISEELLHTHRTVNAVGLLHYELWHLSRSHMTHVKETASLLESQIQDAIVSNDESTTAKRKELKVLAKLRSRLHTWNEQLQYFSQKSQAKEASFTKSKTEWLQSLMYGESFVTRWSWLNRLIKKIAMYFTEIHFFGNRNKLDDNSNVWLDSSEVEMALAVVARYRLGTETNWEFLDKTPSPQWMTILTGLLPSEFSAIHTTPFVITLCLSAMLVALLAYAKGKIIHSIALTILASRKSTDKCTKRAKKTNETQRTSTSMTTTEPASTHTSTIEEDDDVHKTISMTSHNDGNDGNNNSKNDEQKQVIESSEKALVSPHTPSVTSEQALCKRRKWMRVVKVFTIVQQFTPILLFLWLSYMSAVQQIYSTSVFFALIMPTQRALNIFVISAACLFLGYTAMKFNDYLINRNTQVTRKLFEKQKKYN